MKRYFRNTYIARYDECDRYGFLTPAAFLRYLQDVAALDAESVQLGGNGYWVVKRTVISFATRVPIHTRLELKTFGIGFTRITAQRGYEARLVGEEEGEPVVSARSLWVYLDTRGRPTRLPERTHEIWLPDGPAPQLAEEPWPPLPESEPKRADYSVRFSDLDLMKHMNNASYVELLDNAAWESYREAGVLPDAAEMYALEYDIEYGESAQFGEKLEIQSWFDALPSPGRELSRYQSIKRGSTTLLRARSRWLCL